MAAITPAPGMVETQAPTMWPATPRRTADSLLVAPALGAAEVQRWSLGLHGEGGHGMTLPTRSPRRSPSVP